MEFLRALEVARFDPSRVVQGDLRTGLRALVAQITKDHGCEITARLVFDALFKCGSTIRLIRF